MSKEENGNTAFDTSSLFEIAITQKARAKDLVESGRFERSPIKLTNLD